MRAWSVFVVSASLLAAAFAAGCTMDDGIEESTEEGVPVDATPTQEPTPPAGPTVAPDTPVAEPTPVVEPTPIVEPTPTTPTPTPVEPTPTPTPQPTPSPTPAPTAPTPDDDEDETDDDDDGPAWPTEGSFVRYRVTVLESIPGSSGDRVDTFTNLSWTYRDDDWHGTCEGERRSTFGGETSVEEISETYEASDPPHWPLFNTRDVPDEGDDVEAWFVKGCDISSIDREFAGEDGDMYVATDYDDGSPDDFRTEWSREWGLVDSWDWSQRNTHTRGQLTATDAPGM